MPQTAERGREASAAGPAADSLRAKVQAAQRRAQSDVQAEPGHGTARDALRDELRRLDSSSLSWTVKAAMIRDRDAAAPRAMTVADAARLISPEYAAAADRLAELRSEVAYSEKAIQTYAEQRDHAIDQGDARWQAMGTLRQYGHRTGVRPDHAMSTHERDETSAADRMADEEKRRDERMTMLPEIERAEADALDAVRPQAEAKLVQLLERAELAREVQQEKMQAQKEREQTRAHERGRDKDLGFER